MLVMLIGGAVIGARFGGTWVAVPLTCGLIAWGYWVQERFAGR